MTSFSLGALAEEHLATAAAASSGRSAGTVYGGSDHVLRQTMIALTAGTALAEHENPGEATVQVLRGRVRLSAGDETVDGGPGDLLIVPPTRHALQALDDAVVLLTVGKRPAGQRPAG